MLSRISILISLAYARETRIEVVALFFLHFLNNFDFVFIFVP